MQPTKGGMRRSLTTNSLVLVSDPTKSIYEDRWIDDVFHYTGMGLRGDQRIDANQNKTVAESPESDVSLFLFEVFDRGNYIYQGQVELASEPYKETQPDIDHNLRYVWVFPLKLQAGVAYKPTPDKLIQSKQEKKQREASRLSYSELERRAKYSRKGVGRRQVISKTYERNVYVAELAKRIANGKCQLCGNDAPFKDRKGVPYLEEHHLTWLSEGGEDVIENTVALCPNCHRKMHVLNLTEDVRKLNAIVSERLRPYN